MPLPLPFETGPGVTQAQLINAQYNAVNAPYDAGSAAAMVVLQNTNPALYLQATSMAAQQDAARELAKHNEAFSQPRTEMPSAAFNAIQNQYAQQHGSSIGSGGVIAQTPEAHANFILQPGYVSTGYGGFTGNAAAYAEQWRPLQQSRASLELQNQPARSTVPVRDLSSGNQALFVPAAAAGGLGETVTVNVPFGHFTQEILGNSKLLIDKQTGELGIYQPAYSNGVLRGFGLSGGGGRNALQSGMFTVGEAETPYTVNQTDVGTYELPSGAGLSRLGAEAYGGYVTRLDGRILSSETQMARYANPENLANFVSQAAASKSEVPGANIPWSISTGSPAMQYMNERGVIPGAITVPGSVMVVPGTAVTMGDMGLPKPFVSVGRSGAYPVVTLETNVSNSLPENSLMYNALEGDLTTDQQNFINRIGVAGSAAGGFVSNVFLGIGAENQVVKSTSPIRWDNTTILSGGNQTISEMGMWLSENKNKIDLTNVSAVSKYNTNVDIYNAMQKQNPVIATTISQQAGTPDKVYQYGEWSKLNEGAGQWVSKNIYGGITQEQIEAYKPQDDLMNNIAYGIIKFTTQEPLSVIPSALQGGYLVTGGGAAGAGVEAYAGTSLLGSGVAKVLTTPGTAGIIGGAARLAYNYAVPAAFVASSVWGVTEGFTASTQKTEQNIGYVLLPTSATIIGGMTITPSFIEGGLSRVGEAKESLRNTYERVPSINSIINSASDTLFELRQNVSGITRMSKTADRSYYQESPYTAKYQASSETSYGSRNWNIGGRLTGIESPLLLTESSISSPAPRGFTNPSIIEKAFESNIAFTPEQNEFLINQMIIKDIGYAKGYGVQTIPDRPELMTSADRDTYDQITMMVDINDRIIGYNFVQSQMPKYPLLTTRVDPFSNARDLISKVRPLDYVSTLDWEIPQVEIPQKVLLEIGISTNPTTRYYEPNKAVSRLVDAAIDQRPGSFAGLELQTKIEVSPQQETNPYSLKNLKYAEPNAAVSRLVNNALSIPEEPAKDLLVGWRAGSVSYWMIPSPLEESAQNELRSRTVVTSPAERTVAAFSLAQLNAVFPSTIPKTETHVRILPEPFPIPRPSPQAEVSPSPYPYPEVSPYPQPYPDIQPYPQPRPYPQPYPEPYTEPRVVPKILPVTSTTTVNKKKRKPQSYTMFREILPIITPIEEIGGFKSGKSFFRAIGNQQILEVKPQTRDYLHYVDVDQDVRELQQKEVQNQVSDMSGVNFFRTATKQEKAKTGKPIMTYTPTQQELSMAKMVGFGSGNTNKPKKGRRNISWF